jgi:hypothetical protein
MMEKKKKQLISKRKPGNQRLTPHEMKRVIRQRRLVSGTESGHVRYAIKVGQ